jgi:DNA-binding protein
MDTEQKKTFSNLALVLAYLVNAGWKITKTTLYRHQKEGRFRPEADGSYIIEVIDKYARIHLKQAATGKKINAETDELQKKKLEQEISLQQIKIERERFNFEKDQGNYISKAEVELNMALMASVLMTGIRHGFQTEAAAWIILVGGDPKKLGEFINILNTWLDNLSNQLSRRHEYEINIESKEEENHGSTAET